MRRGYRIHVEVHEYTRDAAIREFEMIIRELKAGHWSEQTTMTSGAYPAPYIRVTVGAIPLTAEERLDRIEREVESRLGGFSR